MVWLLALLTVMEPTIEVNRDNTVIAESCRIKPGVYTVADADNNGVIHVRADDITIDFQQATLRGAGEEAGRDELTGMGLSIVGCKNVTIRNARIHGYFFNVHVKDAELVTLERCNASHGFGQRIFRDGKVKNLWLVLRDLNAWRSYGAGFWIENSKACKVVRCTARHMQNGILLVKSDRCELLQSDFCFTSGWGIGLWESCDNRVMSNLVDFVNRPWGGGWGGDSSGVVVVNASHRNRIIGNSFTHGGDGFFLTNARDVGSPAEGACNDNLIAYNDGSYSPHNAFEATFSDGNMFIGNLANHSDHGFWCGYSNHSLYVGNQITDNRSGGISTEHGRGHWVEGNEIARNGSGVHFWHNPDRGYPSRDQTIRNNRFVENRSAIVLRHTDAVVIDHNAFLDNDWAVVAENVTAARATGNRFEIDKRGEGFIRGELDARGNAWKDARSREVAALCKGNVDTRDPDPDAGPVVLYKDSGLPQGWEMIQPAEWAPLDFTNALVYPTTVVGGRDVEFAVVGWGRFALQDVPEGVKVSVERGIAPARVKLSCETTKQFSASVVFDDLDKTETVDVTFLPMTWQVEFYRWQPGEPARPRAGPPAGVFEGEVLERRTVETVAYNWGGGRPSAEVPGDYFAVRATAEGTLPAGEYTLYTISDDGVRVFVDDEVLFENWTWHHPTEDSGSIRLSSGRHKITVEYFEINGAAQLHFWIVPKRSSGGSPRAS
ncbi:MAG: right-handed parallel beta-helix repeat-containing protein [Phycisphaerales bacterium]|nr:MAG: right-handed parallel beta-helix repeat-containing protein [Phycisphaerales bacterium]